MRPTVSGLELRSGRLRNAGRRTLPILYVSFTFRQGVRRESLAREGADGPMRRTTATSSTDWRPTSDRILRSGRRVRSSWSVRCSAAELGARTRRRRRRGADGRPARQDGPTDQVIACGEALLPTFVAADPYGAGVAAVLANVNDLAAMGLLPWRLSTPSSAVPSWPGKRCAG